MSDLVDAVERERIRTQLDVTMLVEAAAGTGKTTELVHRIVAVLREGRGSVESVVAVTFTEKAAGELKLRLRAGLEKARQEVSGGSPRLNLERALSRLEEARVSTIHGFCADLLRERPVEARVDPRFRVMTEGEARQLFRRSFDRWLQAALENPPEGVRRALRRSSFRGAPSGRLEQAAWTLADWRDFVAEWRRPTFDREAEIDRLIALLAGFVELRGKCSAPNRDLLYRDTQSAWRILEDLRAVEAVASRDYDAAEAAFADLAGDRNFRNPRGSGKWYGKALEREDVLKAHGELRQQIEEFVTRADADLAPLLQIELRQAVDAYETIKARTGRLDYLDLLLRARDLVRDCDPVRNDFQRRFTHLFVDEFQDTDPLQAEILLLLAANDASVRHWRDVVPLPGKVFLVGDPKQSIYRFRRADVGVYMEVKDLLTRADALHLKLTTSFRAVPAIQRVVNAAFAPAMKADAATFQADYVPLAASRTENAVQPAVIVLPVPEPLGKLGGVTATAIEKSLPDATGAFIEWLLRESGWTVGEKDDGAGSQNGASMTGTGERRVKIEARHICVLFRRFENLYSGDMTRGYMQALEARGIPHLLVGGSGFHGREEVEAMRAALAAIEWPDDELSVFATLRGSLFAIADEELFEYRHSFGSFHPFRRPQELPEHLADIGKALGLLRELHRRRNRRTVAETIAALLEVTRAPAGLVLRPSGTRVLANVLHLSEMARAYENAGGISFRGFVQQLLAEADGGKAAEAPILEEDSDGVRIMTVHKAKGLEFPIVILADLTARLVRPPASRWIDASRGVCAVRLAGWSPAELLEHDAEELGREDAEGVRVSYVAATRARDLIVIPAVGVKPFKDGWTRPLNDAIYPTRSQGRWSEPAASEREDRSDREVAMSADERVVSTSETLLAPNDEESVRPGRYDFDDHSVVWFDVNLLRLKAQPLFGIRQEELIGKDAPPEIVAADRERYEKWSESRAATIATGARPSVLVETATARATRGTDLLSHVEIIETPRAIGRPAGPSFGALVHAVLATIDLGARRDTIAANVRLQARLLGATDHEVEAAIEAVEVALQQPLLRRAHAADVRGQCRREAPLTLREDDGAVVEGIVDLAFLEYDSWIVVDFKTDRELANDLDVYKRQVDIYARAISAGTGRMAKPILMRV